MRFFGKKNDNASAAASLPPPEPIFDEKLRKKFSHATYGNFFKTCAYRNPFLAVVEEDAWREASHVPDYGWIVKEVVRRREADGQIVRVFKRLNEEGGVSFFDAVKLLSDYESAQENMGHVRVDADEEKELGLLHVKAFGEREGLVFDRSGMPHPTVNGLIVTNGFFEQDAQDKAIAAIKAKQALMKTIPAYALPAIPKDDGAKAQFYQKMYMDVALRELESIRDKILSCWENENPKRHLRSSWAVNDGYRHDSSPRYRANGFDNLIGGPAHKYMNAIRSAFNLQKDEPSDYLSLFSRAVTVMRFYAYVSICNDLQDYMDQSGYYTPGNLARHVKNLGIVMGELGFQDITPENVLVALKNKDNRYKAEINEVLNWVRDCAVVLAKQEDVRAGDLSEADLDKLRARVFKDTPALS